MIKFIIVISLVITLGSSKALAKAYYASKPEMIERSCAIAIIQVKDVKKVFTSGESFDYNELAHVDVEKVLKGTLPSSIELLADENFICAQCRVKPGKYIAFLKPQGSKWACSNWYLSVRPIEEGKVEWYTNNFGIKLSSFMLDAVVKDITAQLSMDKRENKLKDPCSQEKQSEK